MFMIKSFNGFRNQTFFADYELSLKSRFPHGHISELIECEEGDADCKTVEVCAKCRAAEVSWRATAIKNYGIY